MDSGYPTREVVKTASPEMLALAPKDLPEKMGPFLKLLVALRCRVNRGMYLDGECGPLV
jgi:hypothetical protein